MNLLQQIGGILHEVATLGTSSGSSSAGAVPHLNATGQIDDSMLNGTAVGGGESYAGKYGKLNAQGKFDSTMMPTGFGADALTMTASEALTAGDFVNVYNDSGTAKVRKADASAATAGKRAMGFVLDTVASGVTVTVYFEGTNGQCTGLTPGAVFLSGSTAGQATSAAPSTTGYCLQKIGIATSATAVNFEMGEPIILA